MTFSFVKIGKESIFSSEKTAKSLKVIRERFYIFTIVAILKLNLWLKCDHIIKIDSFLKILLQF